MWHGTKWFMCRGQLLHFKYVKGLLTLLCAGMHRNSDVFPDSLVREHIRAPRGSWLHRHVTLNCDCAQTNSNTKDTHKGQSWVPLKRGNYAGKLKENKWKQRARLTEHRLNFDLVSHWNSQSCFLENSQWQTPVKCLARLFIPSIKTLTVIALAA